MTTRSSPSAPRGAALCFAVSALLVPIQSAAAVPVPVVHFLEVGDRGVLYPDAFATAEVEVWSAASFRGVLDAVPRWSTDPAWKEQNVLSGDRTVAEIVLKPNERRSLLLLLPRGRIEFIPGLYRSEIPPKPFAEIVWSLRDDAGRTLVSGRARARGVPEKDVKRRFLHLSVGSNATFARDPDRAFDRPLRYLPYEGVVISGRDFENLSPASRSAILDAVALGRTLVVGPPAGGLGPRLDDLLRRDAALIWRGDRGAEIREVPYLAGLVRTVTVGLGPALWESDENPVGSLLTWPALLRPQERSSLEHWRAIFLLDEEGPLVKTHVRARLLFGGAVAISLVSVGSAALWFASRRRAPLTRPITATFAAGVLLLPVSIYALFVPLRAGNFEGCVEAVYHDPDVGISARFVDGWRGGGGGTLDPGFDFDLVKRGVFSTSRDLKSAAWPTIQTEVGPGSQLRLRPALPGPTASRRLTVHLAAVEDSPSPVRGGLTWAQGSVSGPLIVDRSLRVALLLHPRWSLSLGSLRAGVHEIRDAPVLPLDAQGRWVLTHAEARTVAEASSSGPLWELSGRLLRERALLVVEEAEETPGRLRDELGRTTLVRVLHCQQLAVRGAAEGDAQLNLRVPARQIAGGVTAWVPDHAYGLSVAEALRRETPKDLQSLMDGTAAVSESRNGFREISFRLLPGRHFDQTFLSIPLPQATAQ